MDNNCSRREGQGSEEAPAINLGFSTCVPTTCLQPSPSSSSSSMIQIESVPIYAIVGPSETMASNSSRCSRTELTFSDTVTPNPLGKRSESVFLNGKGEADAKMRASSSADAPEEEVNEAFEEITGDLCPLFPSRRGLPVVLRIAVDRLPSDFHGCNNNADCCQEDGKETGDCTQTSLLRLRKKTKVDVRFPDGISKRDENLINYELTMKHIKSDRGSNDILLSLRREHNLPSGLYNSQKQNVNNAALNIHRSGERNCLLPVSESKLCTASETRTDLSLNRRNLLNAKQYAGDLNVDLRDILFDYRNTRIEAIRYEYWKFECRFKPEVRSALKHTLTKKDWIFSEQSYMGAPSSAHERFPRTCLPVDSAAHRVVCQLWEDPTCCFLANLDASLTLSHAVLPLQIPYHCLGQTTFYAIQIESGPALVSYFSKSRSQILQLKQIHSPDFTVSTDRLYLSRHNFILIRGASDRAVSFCFRSVVNRGRREVRIDDQGLVSIIMDWMQAIGSDVMISDDQLTTALQHLLVSVEKGIERLEWNGVPKTRTNMASSGEGSSSFPRCCHIKTHPVDTKDSSVQTTPEDDNSQEADITTVMDTDLVKREVGAPPLAKFVCIQNDIQSVSVVRKNYIPTCESIATQTSSTLSPSNAAQLKKPQNELMFPIPPVVVRDEDPDDGYCEHILTQPATISQVDPDLLHSEIALLPGCRDASGRSVVIISSNAIKDGSQLSSCHLAQLLLYFHTIPKKEVIGKGFLILIDALKHTDDFWNALDETFCLIEANLSNVVSEVLILFNEGEVHDSNALFPTSRIQYETLSSREKLLNFISKDQVLNKYGGDYIYDHQEWISFRKFLEPFINGCRLSGRHLVTLLEELRGSRLPVSSTLTHQMIEQQKRNVNHTFHDEQLRHLEEEGDTIIKELHSYRTKSPHNHDYRENLERTSVLYDELRKAMAKLARLADKRLNRLEECLQLKTFQEESSQVLSWLCRKGNESLEKHQAIADSLGAIKQQEEEFEKFYFLAMRQIEKGNDLLEEVSTFSPDSCLPKIHEENPSDVVDEGGGVQDLATSLRQHLGSFSERLEGTRERIEDTAKCYQLMDKSYEWALDAMRFVSHLGITNTESPDGVLRQIRCLQDYADNHLQVPEDTFSEMLDLAAKLGNEKLLEQCKVVKLRCEETVDLIKTRQTTLQKVKHQIEIDSLRGPFWEAEDASQTPRTLRSHSQPMNTWLPVGASTPYPGFSSHQRRRSTGGPMGVSASQRYGSPIGSYTAFPSSYYPSKEPYHLETFMQEKEDSFLNHGLITEDLTSQGPIACISKTLLDLRGAHRSGHSSSSSSTSSTSSKDLMNATRKSGHYSMQGTESKSAKKLTRRCQLWQMRDDALEKVKAEVREQTALLRIERLRDCQKDNDVNRSEISEIPNADKIAKKSLTPQRTDCTRGPVPVNTHLLPPITPADSPDSGCLNEISNDVEAKSKKTLMLIMKELIQTERDYVKSLEYIIESYIPELLREDIPQALRGQRNVVFGNIEKIYEFHNQYFLTELEHCESSPFTVGQCFLDFRPQFYLYALYNKNKPKSDALMSEYGNGFFRKKQLELQDKMDLASYLLKPVQRMGKYALLLKQLLKECPEREKEHKALKDAEEMVRFQLRHGNDLLAMDALKDCDVNVKEQGWLLRQDEFIVWQGRSRKCMRHVFLFEGLILFSKARRDPQRKGYEMYQYKHSIKTTDMGMTEQIGDSPTKFEIWFRKRKLNDTFLLQAPNPEVKAAWVSELRGILFNQAVNNKKNFLAELSSMGVGNKPCLDIKPSEDQISDRSISIHQLARAPRFRNSIAVSPGDVRNNRNSIISVTSSSSSGSSQSSFSFYGALNLGFEPGDSPRPLHRSLTQQSQCSTESGFCTDVSTAGDSPENEQPRHKRAERSDSVLSSDSLSTNVSPTEVPCISKLEQSLEENLTTSM